MMMTTTINKLGDDLLVEILIRSFPNPKPACRCKLVCKRWRNLISDPVIFNRRFVSHHKTINEETEPPPPIPFLPVPDVLRPYFTAWNCFEDLFLCGFWGPTAHQSSNGLERFYFVCNPFAKQWIALPLAPERTEGVLTFVARLVCEPLCSTSLDLGDGREDEVYSYSEYRFRVVVMYQQMSDVRLDVFCSESGEWTKDALVFKNAMFPKSVVSCNGKLFWAYKEPYQDGLNSTLVLAEVNPFCLDVHLSGTNTTIIFPEPTMCHICWAQRTRIEVNILD